MSQTAKQTEAANKDTNVLGTFAGLIGLLGAALYFTGWIYRWTYFGFFQLEITTLDLPLESFFMVPVQVFLGSFWAFCKSVFAAVIVFVLIRFTLGSLQWLGQKLARTINFQQSFVDEGVIVAWILVALFHLARGQGMVDARQAAGVDSTLPVITLVTPEKHLAVGRKPGSTDNPFGFRIVGDRRRYEDLLGRETNDPDNARVWRLLLNRNGYFYLFKALPRNATRAQRPIVLAIRDSDSGGNVLILSPEPMKSPQE